MGMSKRSASSTALLIGMKKAIYLPEYSLQQRFALVVGYLKADPNCPLGDRQRRRLPCTAYTSYKFQSHTHKIIANKLLTTHVL